ncbi:glycoside hydrolase family 2 protein [Nocardiopsis mangrovi]|uniref:beta-mannosidase n=1 Tax=Nocardiopsis mangrovi TaxID=1179818 RepID=A0ABV9E1J6_9ACTN
MWFDLHSGWTVRPTGEAAVPPDIAAALAEGVAAEVPGCVHTDLLRAGLIPDPYLDRNEDDVAWMGHADWHYATSFDAPEAAFAAGSVAELVFAGLDTVAEIELNGEALGSTSNMHRPHRFDVGARLRAGRNTLSVTFRSAIRHAEARRAELGDLPSGGNDQPYTFIRKTACNFGWDWGPALVTAGLWKRCGLHVWDTARLSGVRPLVGVAGGAGTVEVRAAVARAGSAGGDPDPLVLRARVDGVEAAAPVPAGDRTGAEAAVGLRVPDPRLWWPHSLGGQPLSRLEVWLEAADGTVLDTWSREIGFRDIELRRGADAIGAEFTVVVNGTPMFVRGANWIPDDCFPTRVDAGRYERRVVQARDAGIDLLRVWGGGIYESDDFYAACDRNGVLVWQDFLFACGAYPEDGGTRAEVEAEARHNVTRLAAHPSLAVWCGNNENYMGRHHWGWEEALAGRPWGAHYYEELLPAVVAELDPTRPYVPGTPFSTGPAHDSLDDDHGCVHLWEQWNRRDFTTYREHVPRFVSEFGWQAPPAWATLTAAVHDSPLAPDSPGVLHHQKAQDGNGKLERGLTAHFGTVTGVDDWHYLAQVVQARAIRTGIEHWRSHRPRCMGTIVWQLNDCWPVTSWSAVDSAEHRKPLWYALRAAYADRLLTIQPRDGGLSVIAVNDAAEPWTAEVRLRRMSADGARAAEAVLPLAAAARATAAAAVPAAFIGADPATEFLVADAGERRALWFFTEDRHLRHPAPAYDAAVRDTGGGHEVTVTARTLLRDLAVFADRLHPAAESDRCLETLLPGETRTIRVTSPEPLDHRALTRSPVLRVAGDHRG